MSSERMKLIQKRNNSTCYVGLKIEKRGQQELERVLRKINGFERKSLFEIDKKENVLADEQNRRSHNMSSLSRYLRCDDFQRIKHGVTVQQARREYFQKILDRSEPQLCGKLACDVFPCKPIKSYHFICRKITPTGGVQSVNLCPHRKSSSYGRNCNNLDERRVTQTEMLMDGGMPMKPRDDIPEVSSSSKTLPQGLTRAKTLPESDNENDTLTKREKFLKLAVHKKRKENEQRTLIDRACHYGQANIPLRKILKPVKPWTNLSDDNSEKDKFLTF